VEEILTQKFFKYRSCFEAFLYSHIGDGGGAPLKVQDLADTLSCCLGPFQRIVLAHWSCCWWPLWSIVLYLHIATAVGSFLESKQFCITVALWGPFESIVLTHYDCCLGPLWK